MFKMMDRVMLLVNNSQRCRLRSRCPSRLSQSEAFTQRSDWRKRGTVPVCYANDRKHCCISTFLPFFLLHPSSRLLFLSWSIRRVWKLIFLLFAVFFILSISPAFPFFCLFPSLHLLILQSQGEVKNIVSIQTSTCWKGNKSWTEVSGANIEEADIWARDWSPSWRAKLKRG